MRPWKLPWAGILLLASGASAGTLSVTVYDETGARVPARVYLSDARGQPLFPTGAIAYRNAKEQHFVPRGGSFQIELPEGRYSLRIERGKEYETVGRQVAIPSSGEAVLDIRLKRWLHMAADGWYSGDMHLHRRLGDMADLLESEDLNAAVPITRWRGSETQISEDPDLRAFLARTGADGVVHSGRDRWFTVLNEELESETTALLVSRLARKETGLMYPVASYGKQARARGALVDSEKATSLELPAIAALGACDTVGLSNNHLWQTGYYREPWGAWPERILRPRPSTCGGFAHAGFDLYYALLNMGFRLKPSAGTACGVHPVPPGWSRIYAHLRGPNTPENWFAAVRAGRTFVTTGPMLFLKANGLEPGDEDSTNRYPLRARIEVRILSLSPIASATAIVNGVEHHVPLREAGPRVYTGATDVTLATSAWIAARWIDEKGETCSVAHTAPVYFRKRGESIPVPRADAKFLLERVRALIEDVRTGRSEGRTEMKLIPGGTEALRRETLRLFSEAEAVYRAKLREAGE